MPPRPNRSPGRAVSPGRLRQETLHRRPLPVANADYLTSITDAIYEQLKFKLTYAEVLHNDRIRHFVDKKDNKNATLQNMRDNLHEAAMGMYGLAPVVYARDQNGTRVRYPMPDPPEGHDHFCALEYAEFFAFPDVFTNHD